MKKYFYPCVFAITTLFSISSSAQTITGSGNGAAVGGYIARFNATTSIKNSGIYQNGGNVGMGVGTFTTPLTPLHVIVSNANNSGIRIDQNSTSASTVMFNNTSSGGRNYSLWSTGAANAGGAGYFMINDNTGSAIRMAISPTGFVGIGTTSTAPLAKLHVHDGALRLTGVVPGSGGPVLLWGGSASTAVNGEWGMEYTTATAGKEGLNFWRPFGATGATGNNFLFLANTGRVGIGTDNPTALLSVNGNVLIGDQSVLLPAGYKLYVETGILTEKVKVAVKNTSNWSDYVFATDYKLKSLNEVEIFVKENKHLPNIPSAEEVVKEGIDLGEMTSKLLGKVEELTLYIIEQNKRIAELEKTNK